ncbi:hypothetical protein SCP_0200800 [Sparassis crispa]|uniref:Uncharacterized protein n=1 Tax=Sparassis crispa TaxID=139825 RepID=A0A401G9S5_9APHY|nr:hypothetical protein SCP_0200800 [Sparassis crispa]GBE78883.1 hypothetical protein SCP_0200800 [Sparassis crispa]
MFWGTKSISDLSRLRKEVLEGSSGTDPVFSAEQTPDAPCVFWWVPSPGIVQAYNYGETLRRFRTGPRAYRPQLLAGHRGCPNTFKSRSPLLLSQWCAATRTSTTTSNRLVSAFDVAYRIGLIKNVFRSKFLSQLVGMYPKILRLCDEATSNVLMIRLHLEESS